MNNESKVGDVERQTCGVSKAPVGWTCTRGKGHEGPCAAIAVPMHCGGGTVKLTPFNLDKALAGAPVVTRLSGSPITGLRDMREFGADDNSALVGIYEGHPRGWYIDGRFILGRYVHGRFINNESSMDLFMAEVPNG